MVLFRAHFDGKVFVPDEPVGLPPNAWVRLLLVTEEDGNGLPLDPIEAAPAFENDAAELFGLGDSGLKFWDNDTDDETWNDALPPA